MSNAPLPPRIEVPLNCRSSVYFIDESGSKGSAGDFFVVAAVKTNDPDFLTRGMETIRTRHNQRRELKFRELTNGSLPLFRELIELLHASGSHLGAFVIDKRVHDPFVERELWEAHAWTVAALTKGMTNFRELATLLVDGISTPKGVAYGSHIRAKINYNLGCTRVVAAVSLDSRTCDGLQLADLVASSIAYQRRLGRSSEKVKNNSPKAQAAMYLAHVFGVADFEDVKSERVNIRTIQASPVSSGRSLASFV